MRPNNTPTTEISAGRDINGTVVIGNGNVILSKPADADPLHQQNTVKDHGTAYSAAQGDIHIHHHGTKEDDTSGESEA